MGIRRNGRRHCDSCQVIYCIDCREPITRVLCGNIVDYQHKGLRKTCWARSIAREAGEAVRDSIQAHYQDELNKLCSKGTVSNGI